MIDDTLQRTARAFPLFVFLSRQFLQPRVRHEERFSFCVIAERLPKDAPLKTPRSGERIRNGGAKERNNE